MYCNDMQPMENPMPPARTVETRPSEDAKQQIRTETRAAIERMNVPAHPEILFPNPVPAELAAVRSALNAPRFQNVVKGLTALHHLSPRITYDASGLTLTVDGKIRGTVSAEILRTGVWEGDVLQLLREPLGGIDRPFDELSRMQAIDAAETRKGLLSNALRLQELQQSDLVGSQRLEEELGKLLGSTGRLDIRPAGNDGLLIYQKGNDEVMAYIQTGKRGILDGAQHQISRNALRYALFRPHLDELPNAALAAHVGKALNIDTDGVHILHVKRETAGYRLEFTDAAGTPRSTTLQDRREQR